LASMAFVEELRQRYGDRVTVWPQDEQGLLDLEALLGEPQQDTLVYCCGPEPLLAAVEAFCEPWPHAALHVERFAAKPRAESDPSAELAFEVVLSQSGSTLSIPAGMSVLEGLEASGIEAPNSCREGICGTCETAVLEGVPEHRDSLLSDDERAANDTMMICVGRSRSPRLVLDL
ncbi:MAG: iron-sulfur cluster-binding domain-containing protein, partial [Nocardioides sp.]